MVEQSFEKLKVWQKAHQLSLDIHKKLLPLMPKEEKYGLSDQLRRSSKSIGANIAEGAGRYYYMDNVRFCYNARGSLDEILNHLILQRKVEQSFPANSPSPFPSPKGRGDSLPHSGEGLEMRAKTVEKP